MSVVYSLRSLSALDKIQNEGDAEGHLGQETLFMGSSLKLRAWCRLASCLTCLVSSLHPRGIWLTKRNYPLNSNNAPTRRSDTLSGSCRAISMILSNFFTPIWSPDDNPSLSEPKPASASILIARFCSCSDGNSSTSWTTCSRARREDIGGTRISESKVSERPRSVRMDLKDEVAMMSKRRPYFGNLVVHQHRRKYLDRLSVVACQTTLVTLAGQHLRTWLP